MHSRANTILLKKSSGIILWFLLAPYVMANTPPDGLSVVGLADARWSVHVADQGEWTRIDEVESPRTVAYHRTSGKLAFVGVDGRLRVRELSSGRTQELEKDSESSRFTQPHYSANGERLFAVELPGGKSRRTNIVGFNAVDNEKHLYVRKRTAQFQPFSDEDQFLYYTTAICVDDCEGMIWELWRRSFLDGQQEQLTLMNALANQPHVSRDGWLYFTSNKDNGRFHIWRMRPSVGAKTEQITSGEVRDSDPTTTPDGRLLFLRKTPEGSAIMQWNNGALTEIDTTGLNDMRNLDMGR